MSLCTSTERDSESVCYQKALEMAHRQLPLTPDRSTSPSLQFYEDISNSSDKGLFTNYSNPADQCEDEVGTYREPYANVKKECTTAAEKRKSFEGCEGSENAQDSWWSADPPNLFLSRTDASVFSPLKSPPSFPWGYKKPSSASRHSSGSSSSSAVQNGSKIRENVESPHRSDQRQQKLLQNRLEGTDKKNREKTGYRFDVGTQTFLGADVVTQKIAVRRTPTPPPETAGVKGNVSDITIVLNRDYWACRNSACILRPISLKQAVVLPAKKGVVVSTNILFARDTNFHSGIPGLDSHMYSNVCELQCNWMETQCKSIVIVKEGPVRPGFTGRLYLYVFNKSEKDCSLAEHTPIASLKTCHYTYPL